MTTKRSREDKLSSSEVMAIIKDIRSINGTEKQRIDASMKKYPDFAEDYPHLLKMACETTFDMSRLEYMLNLRDSINHKKVTFEDASKEIGQVMFDAYIRDKIDMSAERK